jgi:hypothetical protein
MGYTTTRPGYFIVYCWQSIWSSRIGGGGENENQDRVATI